MLVSFPTLLISIGCNMKLYSKKNRLHTSATNPSRPIPLRCESDDAQVRTWWEEMAVVVGPGLIIWCVAAAAASSLKTTMRQIYVVESYYHSHGWNMIPLYVILLVTWKILSSGDRRWYLWIWVAYVSHGNRYTKHHPKPQSIITIDHLFWWKLFCTSRRNYLIANVFSIANGNNDSTQ